MATLNSVQLVWLNQLGVIVGVPAGAGAARSAAQPGGPVVNEAADEDAAVAIVTVDPSDATLVVGASRGYSATIELGTEIRLLSGSEVEWRSSDPAITIDAHGQATARSLSKDPVRITARDLHSGFSGSTTATVVAPAPKKAPPAPAPELQFITLSETAGLADRRMGPLSSVLHLHSARQYHATAVYAGYADEMSDDVLWSADPAKVVTVDKHGLATAVGVGSGTITATSAKQPKIANQVHVTVPEPVLQSIELQLFSNLNHYGMGGATLYRDSQFEITATGQYSNGRPRVLTDQVVWTSSNTKRGKVDAKGVFTAGMEAGVVTVTARHAKSGISGSQEVIVLTDVNPKTHISAANFPPPTGASGAGAQGKGSGAGKGGAGTPAAPPLESGRGRRDCPPYGALTYWDHDAKGLLPLVDKALPLLDRARATYVKLGGQLQRLDEIEKRIAKAANAAPDQAKDISANVSPRAKDLAEIAEAQKNHVSSTVTASNALRADLWIAQRAMKNVARTLEAAEKNDKAAALRERAQKQEALLDALLPLIGAVIEGTVNALKAGPVGTIKPAYDALAALFKFAHSNSLKDEAEALEKDAKEILKEVGAEDFRIATDKVLAITSHLADLEKNAKDYLDDYVRTRRTAEEEFDRNPRSSFRFADYARAVELSEQTAEMATQVVNQGMEAESAVGSISGWFYDRDLNSPAERANAPVYGQMSRDARGWWELAAVIRSQNAERRAKLQATRAKAHDTLVETRPGSGAAKPR